MKKRNLVIAALSAIAIGIVVGVTVFSGTDRDKSVQVTKGPKKVGLIKDVGQNAAAKAKKPAKKLKQGVKSKKAKAKAGKKKKNRGQFLKRLRKAAANAPKQPAKERFADLPPAEKNVAAALQEALDADSKSDILKAAEAAMKSSNSEVRQFAVESLSWCGSKALPELTSMMADADPEVAEAAMDAVQNALTEIDDPLTQFRTAQSYMATFKGNDDALTMFSGILSSSAGDILSNEETPAETQLDNRKVIAETFGQMIGEGGKYAEKAKETYRDITGNDWKNDADAMRWAADPDAYEESAN